MLAHGHSRLAAADNERIHFFDRHSLVLYLATGVSSDAMEV